MRSKHGTDSVSLSEETKRNIYFYHHSIEDHIASLAEQAGDKNLVAPITAELVRLLEAKTLWESFRHSQSLPEMRTQRNGDRTGGWAGSAPRVLAADVFSPASGHRTLSAKARKAISKAQRERWARAKRQPKGHRRDYKVEYWKRKAARTKSDGSPDLRGSPEARAKQAASMARNYRDPKWRKAMLKRMEAMRARKKGKKFPMSEETKAKLRAARLATVERKRAEGAA